MDYEVVWAGRGPIPGLTGDGFVYRTSRLLEYAPGSTGWITTAESAAMQVPPSTATYNNRPVDWKGRPKAGRPVTSQNRTRECHCGRRKVPDMKRCMGCITGKVNRQTGARCTQCVPAPAHRAKARASRRAEAA